MTEVSLLPKVSGPPRTERDADGPPPGRARLLLVQTQAERAGAQEISRLLAEGLTRRGYEVHQLFFYRRTDSFDAAENVHFSAQQRPASPAEGARFLYRLNRDMARIAPDVVLTFQHYGNVLGAPLARLAGVRHVIATQTSAPSVVNGLLRRLDRWMGAFGGFDRIVFNSRETVRFHARHPAGYRRRMVLIEHGFGAKTARLAKRAARRHFDLPADAVLLGSVARLHKMKRLDDAVRVLAAEPSWHLALAGQGAEREALEGLAEQQGVASRLHFVGERSAAEIAEFLAALDVFVFPSAAETFGLAPVEAAQAGVPVVANDLTVLREVLAVDGKPCALFVDATDTAALTCAIRRVLEDRDLAAALTASGRRLSERYSLDAMVDAYAKLIEEVLRG